MQPFGDLTLKFDPRTLKFDPLPQPSPLQGEGADFCCGRSELSNHKRSRLKFGAIRPLFESWIFGAT